MDELREQQQITDIVTASKLPADEVNRTITGYYHQLSERIRHEVDADGLNLDWCGFAKWSSHTVGLDLNPNLVGAEIDELADRTVEWVLKVLPDEQLHSVAQPFLETALLAGEIQEPGFLARHLNLGHLLSHLRRPGSLFTRITEGHLPPEFLRDALHAAIVKLLQQASDVHDHLGARVLRFGNIAIFRDMGAIFLELANGLAEQRPQDEQSDTKFANDIIGKALSTPKKTPPPGLTMDLLATDDQLVKEDEIMGPRPQTDGVPQDPRLVDGIKFYLRARRDRDPAHRAELMLAGSMNFSLYEQDRANRLIAIGISAPVRARLIPVVNALSEVPVPDDEVLLAGPKQDPVVIRGVVRAVTENLTDLGLVVEIAGNRVRLGHPDQLPPPHVTPTLTEVNKVMDAVKSRAVCPARNWTDLNYRLGFIGQYFAAFQQNPLATREP